MIRVACRYPSENADDIVRRGLPLIGAISGTSGVRKPEDFGIRVAGRMLAITGTVLPPPKLVYKSPMQVINPGVWNLSSNVAFNRPGLLRTNGDVGCLVITFHQSRSTPETTQFMEELGKYLIKYGINWPKRHKPASTLTLTKNSNDNHALLDENFLRIKKSGVAFTIIVLPGYDAELYSQVKYFADMKYGCHTLCVVPKPPKNAGQGAPLEINKQPSYLANLALKINLKLGGVNHQLEVAQTSRSSPRIMYLGIDVTHPTGTESVPQAPSIAGVVANCNSMLVEALSDMVTERLKSWKDQECLPEKVIVYRDGVSESQYKQKVIIVLANYQRFYPVSNEQLDERSGNVLPGTVVDRGCTMAREFDFFMVAHAGIQGTCRPAHYVVLKDESNFTANELQNMTHNLSYVFGRATLSVSIATPVYYADILCERGRCYLYDTFHRKDHEAAVPYNESQSKWLWGVHKDLAESMFYI
ncbi:uncharacterized protein GIQ15_03892 [Arthroderma uncinatum]|uniref:uncharacterized protein n=1 Tax=Arthroderma uncinatum TaxID=74035 RepID=UPI00144A5DD7|nr:uncharacterized protein GIQ15_03892 [Arthroderma uncinatum]KAF3481133.1 hypothetical protein GIQ15_03892 [Arthroderma uncinatum]